LAPRSKDQNSTPDDFSVTGGGGRTSSYDIGQKLGSIDQSITYLEASSSDTIRKLARLITEVASAKGSLRVIQWILGIVGGVGLVFLGFIAVVAEMWLKNHMGWK
jgi:hypothetical protein